MTGDGEHRTDSALGERLVALLRAAMRREANATRTGRGLLIELRRRPTAPAQVDADAQSSADAALGAELISLIRSTAQASAPDDTGQAAPPQLEPDQTTDYDPDTIEELANLVEKHADAETGRLALMRAAAAALVGIVGGIIALSVNHGREMLNQALRLGDTGQWVAAASLMGALVLIVGSAVAALDGLRTQRDWRLTDKELDELGTKAWYAAPKAQAQLNYYLGLIKRIKTLRKGQRRVRTRLQLALVLLGLGLSLLVVNVGVFAERTIECDVPATNEPAKSTPGDPCPKPAPTAAP